MMKTSDIIFAGLGELSKHLGIAILDIPIFKFDGRIKVDAPAFTNPDGVFISNKLLQYPKQIPGFLAHEIFHPVINEPNLYTQFSPKVINVAADYRINFLLHKLFGYDVRTYFVPGLYDKQLGALPSIEAILQAMVKQDPQLRKYEKMTTDDRYCNNRVLHPAITLALDHIREKFGLQKPGQRPVYLMDAVDLKRYTNVSDALRGFSSQGATQLLDVDKCIQGLWCSLFMDRAYAGYLPTQKKLTRDQALCYIFPSHKFREYSVGNASESGFIATRFMKQLENEIYYNREQLACARQEMRLLSRVLKKQLCRPIEKRDVPACKADLLVMRDKAKQRAKKYNNWIRVRPMSKILKGLTPKIAARSTPRVAVLGSTQIEHATGETLHELEVQIPNFNMDPQYRQRIRACAFRTRVDYRHLRKLLQLLNRQLSELMNNGGIEQSKDPGNKDAAVSKKPSSGAKNGITALNKAAKDKLDAGLQPAIKEDGGTGCSKQGGADSLELDRIDQLWENRDAVTRILLEMAKADIRMSQKPKKPTEIPSTLTMLGYGNDLANLIPSEVALLSHKFTKLAFLAKVANHSLLVNTNAQDSRSPVLILLDCSGSMGLRGYQRAAGSALAVVKKLRSAGSIGILVFDEGIRAEAVWGKNVAPSPMELDRILLNPSMGGTNFNVALRRAYAIKEEHNWKTLTIILVTDGLDTISQSVKNLKKGADKSIAILTRGESKLGTDFFDRVETTHTKNVGGALAQQALAI